MENLKYEISKISNTWKSMKRGTEEERKAAEEYYKSELMPLIQQYFVQTYGDKYKCEALILTLGTSYEPLVLSISALQPQNVMILYTEKTGKLLDDVIEFTKLKPSQYTTSKIDQENPLQLYRRVKEIYEEWGKPSCVFVDFTGGTKSMAAGCAMAGSAIGAKLIYIGNDSYLDYLKKPEPGSEKLYMIEDPYEVFGDLKCEQAIYLFNNMDYISACRIFEELNGKVPGTKKYAPLKYLAKAYDAWDSLNIKDAKTNLSKCLDSMDKEVKLNKNYILKPYEDKIKKQFNALERLDLIHSNLKDKDSVFKNIVYIIANLYCNAIRREKQGKYEMAALLLYRVLETIEQKRLWNYGIDTANADYSVLYEKTGFNKDSLVKRINDIRNMMEGFLPVTEPERIIGLLSGYILLAAIGDEVIRGDKKGWEQNRLNRLRDKVKTRDKSIFAHGFEFIEGKRYSEFKKLVEDYINSICIIENMDRDIFSSMEFIKL